MEKIKEKQDIPRNLIHPNDWNPNFQDDSVFNELVKEIEEDGFDHPVQVCPCNCELIEDSHYRIVGGEHRWKAAGVLNYSHVPCVVYEDWDDDKQKIKTMRRNLLTGHTDPKKFTKMVKDLLDKGYDLSSMSQVFGFGSQQEFDKYFIRERDKEESSFLDALVEESRKEKYAVDSISDVITNIFSESAETIDQDYLIFTHRGSMVAVVLCDGDTGKSIKKVHERLSRTGETMTVFMNNALEEQLDKVVDED